MAVLSSAQVFDRIAGADGVISKDELINFIKFPSRQRVPTRAAVFDSIFHDE
jgi:hypothetical protein